MCGNNQKVRGQLFPLAPLMLQPNNLFLTFFRDFTCWCQFVQNILPLFRRAYKGSSKKSIMSHSNLFSQNLYCDLHLQSPLLLKELETKIIQNKWWWHNSQRFWAQKTWVWLPHQTINSFKNGRGDGEKTLKNMSFYPIYP